MNTSTYEIFSTAASASMGTWEAASEREALEAMFADAGAAHIEINPEAWEVREVRDEAPVDELREIFREVRDEAPVDELREIFGGDLTDADLASFFRVVLDKTAELVAAGAEVNVETVTRAVVDSGKATHNMMCQVLNSDEVREGFQAAAFDEMQARIDRDGLRVTSTAVAGSGLQRILDNAAARR